MKRKQVLSAGISLATLAVLASGCSSSGSGSSSSSSKSSGEQVGIILPDAVTSPRWMNADQPALQQQCSKDGLSCDIQNANDQPATELSEGENMIDNEHVQVLVLASLDQPTAETLTTKAHAAGVKVIDYDRVYGGANAEPDYYVSFNGVTVGQQQGNALVSAIKAAGIAHPDVAVLNGASS
jgi:D-xylose transport system substrate-binding protein